jgi:hypothetical protein
MAYNLKNSTGRKNRTKTWEKKDAGIKKQSRREKK